MWLLQNDMVQELGAYLYYLKDEKGGGTVPPVVKRLEAAGKLNGEHYLTEVRHGPSAWCMCAYG